MKEKTLVLCNSQRQADDVLEVVIKSKLGVTAEIVEICENGQRWVQLRYNVPAELLVLGVLLGQKTNLYND